ncbi:MAG TPA: SRPBCC domain-containing protein [Chloroflexia bacterium]|nr:SRPBCC domain-containing protein [Chloroflexia bacterium]
MGNILHIQLDIAATKSAIFRALTDSAELTSWFAEHADVSIPDKRYDFWGRFTPETPGREQGGHPLLDVEPDSRLRYGWNVRGADTVVEFNLEERAGGTLVVMRQENVRTVEGVGEATLEDFWFLSLENLRRHVDGNREKVRCDYSTLPRTGDIRHQVMVDGPPEQVFDALIKPEQLERWIASKATVEPHAGGRYEFGWGEGIGAAKILEIVPNEKLAYSWQEDAGTEMVVTWTLEGSGGKTRLTLVHSGFAPDKETGGIQEGWLNFISWVKSIVEYGPGWQTPVKLLEEGWATYYAATIGERQGEIRVPSGISD